MFLELDLNHELSNLKNTDKTMMEKKIHEDSVNIFRFSPTSNNKPVKAFVKVDMYNYFENIKLNKSRLNIVSIFASYINLCYYFGVIPYRVAFDEESGLWKLKSSNAQKLFCYLAVWVPICYYELTNIPSNYWYKFLHARNITAKSYFRLFFQIFETWGMVQYLWIFWKYRNQIIHILNSNLSVKLLDTENRGKYESKFIRRCQLYINAYYLLMIGAATMMFFLVYDSGTEVESPHIIFQKLMVDGKNRVFFTTNLKKWNNFTRFSLEQPLEPADVVFGILETWLRWCKTIVYTCNEMIYQVLPVTLWLSTKMFEQSFALSQFQELSDNWPKYQQDIIMKYESLKGLSREINAVFAFAYFVEVLEISLRITFLMNSMIASKDIVNITNAVSWLFCPIMAIILSGETFRKMDNFRLWLMQKHVWHRFSETNQVELHWLIKDVERGSVGLGLPGLYKFSYAFVSQIFSLGVTLFLINFEKE